MLYKMAISKAVLIGIVAFSMPIYAQCLLSGQVDSKNVPISGTKIILINDNRVVASAVTKADGSYNVAYTEPSSSAPTVQIIVEANGYLEDKRNIFRSPQQKCPLVSTANFSLLAAQSVSENQSANPSFTIFISPFELYGSDDESLATKFNQDLPDFIFHKIMDYKTNLELGTVVGDMSIKVIEEVLSPSQGAEIRSLGHQKGALAMVVGDVAISSGENKELGLISTVKPIPIFENIEINSMLIKDTLPAGKLRPSTVGQQLNDHWGKQALIAYVLQQLSMHQGAWDKTELDKMERILISVKSTLSGESDPYKSAVDQLLMIVKEKRA